jgi:hypothetical protein
VGAGAGRLVLADQRTALAQLVLGGGPSAMRKAEELAEVVLAEASPELSKMLGLHGAT